MDCLTEAKEIPLAELFFQLHQTPELGRREYQTARLVRERLSALGILWRPCADTGTVGLLEGKHPHRSIALRADMDALPLQEETGLPYASRVDGVMHACGHDFHVAALLGAAELLARHRERLDGTVKFFFQPDEEGQGGAERMIREGCMENPPVEAVFACHTDSTLPVGCAAFPEGFHGAASAPFTITLRGTAAHGAKPHRGSDVIVAGSQLVMALQTLVSRRISPTCPAVVTVGSFHGGNAPNALPETAVLCGILRTADDATRQYGKEALRSIACGIAAAMGVTAEVDIADSYPACQNDPAMTRLAKAAAEKLGVMAATIEQGMGTDDFGCFTRRAAGCYWNIGVGEGHGNHSPRFIADPAALPLAAAIHTRTVWDYWEESV